MVKRKVVFDKRGDEVVTVVIIFVSAQSQRLICRFARRLEFMREQLRVEMFIAKTLINEDALRIRCATLFHEFAGVMFAPHGLNWSEIV